MRNFIWICLTGRLLRCKGAFFSLSLGADASRSYLSCISPRESAVHLVKVIVEWRTAEIGRLAKYIRQSVVLVRAQNWCYPLGLIAVWPEDWTQEDKEAHTLAAKARSVSHTHTGALWTWSNTCRPTCTCLHIHTVYQRLVYLSQQIKVLYLRGVVTRLGFIHTSLWASLLRISTCVRVYFFDWFVQIGDAPLGT